MIQQMSLYLSLPRYFWNDRLKKITFNIYFWERERQSVSKGGAEREGDTESEAGSGLWAVSTELDAGLELTDHEIMTQVEVRHLTDWATQVPQKQINIFKNF